MASALNVPADLNIQALTNALTMLTDAISEATTNSDNGRRIQEPHESLQ